MHWSESAASRSRFIGPRGCALMVAGWFLFGLVWAISTPVSGVMDEPAHMIRVIGATHGEWRGAPADSNYRKVFIEGIGSRRQYEFFLDAGRQISIPAKLAPPPLKPCIAEHADRIPGCPETYPRAELTPGRYYTYVGIYPPLPYAISSLGARLGHSYSAAVHFARLVNVLFSSCLLGLALFAQRRTRFNAICFGLAVAPAVVSLMSSANPSGLEAASAVTVWACLMALGSPHVNRRIALLGFAVGGVVLLNARPASWAWFIGILAVSLLFCGRQLLRQLRTRAGAVVIGILGVAGAIALAWQVKMMPHPPAGSLRLDDPPRFGPLLEQVVGVFGWYEVQLPVWAIGAWCAAFAGCLVTALATVPWRRRLLLLLLTASVPLAATVYDAYMKASGGYGVQGRYLWPLVLGLPILASQAPVERVNGRVATLATHVTRAAMIVIAADQVLAIAVNARRYDGGRRLWPLISPLAHARWSPHLGWSVTFLLTIVAAVAWLAGVLSRTSRDTDFRRRRPPNRIVSESLHAGDQSTAVRLSSPESYVTQG